MLRLLIVDDEAHIVDGLYEFFIKNKQADLDVLKAYSAAEALNWLDEFKVDVLLTDVNMPKMNGMALVKEVEGRWPRCKVVLLTGHNEFEYAHQAIRSPVVVDYLLKTEGMDKIKDTVLHAFRIVSDELEISQQQVLFKDKMPKVLFDLQRRLLKDASQSSQGSSRLVQESFDALQMQFRVVEPLLLTVIAVEDWGKYASEEDRRLMIFGIGNIAEELLGAKAIVKCTDLDANSLACYVQWSARNVNDYNGQRQLLRFVHGTLETFQEACRTYLQVSVSVASSDGIVSWQDVSATVNRLQLALLQGPSKGMEKWMLISLNEPGHLSDATQNRKKASIAYLDSVFQAILNGNRKEAERLFRQFCGVYAVEGPDDPFDKMQILHVMANHLLVSIDRLDLKSQVGDLDDWFLFLRFDAQIPWSKALSVFHRWMERMIDLRFHEGRKSNEEAPMLEVVHHYIHAHLEDDLSLSRIAEKVSLNPSYLSRWYKKTTGEAISDYINRVKIDKAKELLSSSSLKIQEVSSKLGFTDPHYFFRFFKKAEKCTPSEFRDRLTKENAQK